MRAIWFILKLPLKILMAPVILSLTLFVWICVGIVYVSGLVLGLISMVVALLGVAVLITYSLQNGIILLVIASSTLFSRVWEDIRKTIPTLCIAWTSM